MHVCVLVILTLAVGCLEGRLFADLSNTVGTPVLLLVSLMVSLALSIAGAALERRIRRQASSINKQLTETAEVEIEEAEVEIKELLAPTRDEIQALACLHVTERLRSRRKINTAFRTLAGVSEERVESAWAQAEQITDPVSPEMVKVLYSNGWISSVGGGCYTLTPSGEKQLATAVTATVPAQMPA